MAEGLYSLLGRATTSDYKRRRDEERDYRRDLRRDQIKASLLGMVLNPIAQQISTGISGAIQDRFGGRLEDFKMREDNYQNFKKNTKEANTFLTDFNGTHLKGMKKANSTKDYVTNTYLPSIIEDNVDKLALKKYGVGATLENIWAKDTKVKNEYLRAVSNQLFDVKDVDGLVEIFDKLQDIHLSAPDKSIAFARLDKRIQKAIGRDGMFPALRRKIAGVTLEDTLKRGNAAVNTSPYKENIDKTLALQQKKRAIKDFDPRELATIFSNTEDQRQLAMKPDIVNQTKEIIVDAEDDTLLREKVTNVFNYARPRFNSNTNALSNTFTDTNIEKVVTAESIAQDTLKKYAKLGKLRDLYNEFNEPGRALIVQKFDEIEKGLFEKIMAESEMGFQKINEDGVVFTDKLSRTPAEIARYYEVFFKAMRNPNITNSSIDKSLSDLRFAEAITKSESIGALKADIITNESYAKGDSRKFTPKELENNQKRLKTLTQELRQILNSDNQRYELILEEAARY